MCFCGVFFCFIKNQQVFFVCLFVCLFWFMLFDVFFVCCLVSCCLFTFCFIIFIVDCMFGFVFILILRCFLVCLCGLPLFCCLLLLFESLWILGLGISGDGSRSIEVLVCFIFF